MNNIFKDFIVVIGDSLLLVLLNYIFPYLLFIDRSHYCIWFLIISLVLFILNKTIKPTIVWITLPFTTFSLGLLYPIVNFVILKICNYIIGNHLFTGGFCNTLLLSIIISIFNYIIIDDKFIKEGK